MVRSLTFQRNPSPYVPPGTSIFNSPQSCLLVHSQRQRLQSAGAAKVVNCTVLSHWVMQVRMSPSIAQVMHKHQKDTGCKQAHLLRHNMVKKEAILLVCQHSLQATKWMCMSDSLHILVGRPQVAWVDYLPNRTHGVLGHGGRGHIGHFERRRGVSSMCLGVRRTFID